MLDRDNLEQVHQQILADFGPCDVLINGAGGNNPRATTDNEFHYEAKDIENCKTFFDLDKSGVEFVFSLNWLGTLLPTQVFAVDMIDPCGQHPEHRLDECLHPADQDPGIFGRQVRGRQLHRVAGNLFC